MDLINKKYKLIRQIVFAIFAIVFVFSSYNLVSYYVDVAKMEKYDDNLRDDGVVIVDDNPISDPNYNPLEDPESDGVERAPIYVDFEAMKVNGKDIVAWVYCPNSDINLPIVHGSDNQYYVRHLPDRTYNRAGSIFIDYRNKGDFSDFVTIIYGHNRKKDARFTSVTYYKKQSYYNEHKIWYIVTEDKAYKVEIFAGLVMNAYDDFYEVKSNSDKAYQKYIDYAIKHSTFKSEYTLKGDEKIVVFSTCVSDYEDARYVLLGALVEIEQAKH